MRSTANTESAFREVFAIDGSCAVHKEVVVVAPQEQAQ
jgi:hypothetical protein